MNKLCSFLLFVTTTVVAATSATALSFDEFEHLVRSLKLDGYAAPDEVVDEETEFSATFTAGKGFVRIKTEQRDDAPGWDAEPYTLDGKKAEFVSAGRLNLLVVDLKEIEVILTISSNSLRTRAEFEAVARQTGLLRKMPASVAWPKEIPVAHRVAGTLVQVEKSEAETDGYTTEFSVTLLMGPELRKSFAELAGKYSDPGNCLVFPDSSMLTHPYGEIGDVTKACEDGEKIVLTYSLP